ncbi:MAG: ATPase, T2SS/T4P/T4SS family [Coriobacteriia bacterium]|nr:ATPase, T2SS/T4P/T4SS family [Coriobacteriia bacterium]
MAETTLTDKVLDTLVTAGLLTMDQLASVREAAADGASVATVLQDRGLVTAADVGSALEDELGVPRVDLSSYAPDEDALELVPAALARERRMLPLFEIDGTLTVAVGDPMDVLRLDDIARELSVELDPVLADPTELLGAIVQYYGEQASAMDAPPVAPLLPPVVEHVPEEPEIPLPPVAEEEFDVADLAASLAVEDEIELPVEPIVATEPDEVPLPPSAVPEADTAEEMVEVAATIEQIAAAEASSGPTPIDLDILAVADSTKVALLVTDILTDAASRGASRIHLLPYKDDFFLVYRVKGRLEKVASAPLSLQGALVEGLKNFARVGAVGAGVPAMGRIRTRLADQELVLTVSVVPTIAGQRAVVSLVPFRAEPRGLGALGMSEAEVRALHAMVERGRGILLVAAPVAEGRSSSYYALLAHAAAAGKTAYSVERSVEYEIPAVAQVLVNPGSPIAPAAYFAAGMRQDTDVVAIDGMSTVADVQTAVEAAGAGRLVIATFAAGDIVSAIRRMLDLGAEPHGLASALTLAVGQRLVRTNCPNCTIEKPSDALRSIPGITEDVVNRTGTGCPNCGKTGFGGVTAIFEVLPFTDPVRAAVARGASSDVLASAAHAAGMRPLAASGLTKVAAGTVSADELDRVLRLSS